MAQKSKKLGVVFGQRYGEMGEGSVQMVRGEDIPDTRYTCKAELDGYHAAIRDEQASHEGSENWGQCAYW
jgi:hypothetical protein